MQIHICALAIFGITMVRAVASGAGFSDKQAPSIDFLVPIDKDGEKAFRSLIECKLWVTPSGYARMTVLPSWEPEATVAVYPKPSEKLFFVTLTEASKNIAEAVDEQSSSANAIKVMRIDAPISRETAMQLKQVWEKMISQAHTFHVAQDYTLPIDGETVEFSQTQPDGTDKTVQLPDYPGPKPLALQKLGEVLVDFAKASPLVRPKLEEKMRAMAASLLK